MKVWQKIALVFVVYTIVFSAAFQIMYGSILEPEPDKYVDRIKNGQLMADKLGSSYSEIPLVTDGPEYGYTHEEKKESFEKFKERINRTLGKNDSALIAVFSKDYLNSQILEEYWSLKIAGNQTMVAKVLEPSITYLIPVTEWGPFNKYSLSWQENITDNRIVFSKPKADDLQSHFYFHAFFTYVSFTVGLIAVVGFSTFMYLCIWIAWIALRERKRRKDKKA